jgi:hypothetical protein
MSGGRKVFTFTGVPVTGQPRGTGPDVLDPDAAKRRRSGRG